MIFVIVLADAAPSNGREAATEAASALQQLAVEHQPGAVRPTGGAAGVC
jgi:hypothetical protein